MRARSSGWIVAAGLALAGCKEDETVWVRFNGDDAMQVAVTVEPPGPPAIADLHSTTGSIVIGTATLDPGSGPPGTDHTLTLLVSDEYEDYVGRASVVVDAGPRGREEIELVQDSADHGLWWRVLTSVGGEGETRTDTFGFRLWSEEEAAITDTDAQEGS